MPKVSFIVPVYKVEKFLRRCLDSILDQTFHDWEAVCVNDGSPDGSRQILSEYASKDSRFKIVDKENGGLSDARNSGVEACSGDFVIFVDSDDFIHPQTAEISLGIQERTDADIVSWYKNGLYRSECWCRHTLGLDIVNYKPLSYKFRYNLDKVSYYVTDDVISVVSEESHPKTISRPLKHNYVWRHLLKRSLIQDIKFLKGVTFEDFPWWSEVLLRKPKVAVSTLPFYYYFINFSSIDRASSRNSKTLNWIRGLEHSFNLYSQLADEHQMRMWSMNLKWPVIKGHIACRLCQATPDDPLYPEMYEKLSRLAQNGAFDDPFTKIHRLSRKLVLEFLAKTPQD